MAYVFSAVQHLRDRPMRLEIQIDGFESLRCLARSVLVGNVGQLQGGSGHFGGSSNLGGVVVGRVLQSVPGAFG